MEIKCNMDLIFNFVPLLLRILWKIMGNKGNYCKKNPGKNLQATPKTPFYIEKGAIFIWAQKRKNVVY